MATLARWRSLHIIARDLQPPPIEYVKVSGGLLSDMTVHFLDLLCWLTDEAPVEVHASGACLVDPEIGQAGDIDTVMVTLKMPGGRALPDHQRPPFGFR